MANKRFKQLLRFQFGEGRFIVVSRTADGRISMGQQIRLPDEEDKFVFIKNAFIFNDPNLFLDFINKLNKIINNVEGDEKDGKEKA